MNMKQTPKNEMDARDLLGLAGVVSDTDTDVAKRETVRIRGSKAGARYERKTEPWIDPAAAEVAGAEARPASSQRAVLLMVTLGLIGIIAVLFLILMMVG